MKILVLGGTRFFGKHLVEKLLENHDVTLATRGISPDGFGGRVSRLTLDRTDSRSIGAALAGRKFDVVYDNIAYCSNDVKRLMEAAQTKKYILTSSASVYDLKPDLQESGFDPLVLPVTWCERDAVDYGAGKQEAERALYQSDFAGQAIAVRFPFVIGTDDYTRRLRFYVEHMLKGQPMHIDNPDAKMSFIHSPEAGAFLAFLADKDYSSPVNGASDGVVSLREVLAYVTAKTGAEAVLAETGEAAPYNGARDYSICTGRAQGMGYAFQNIREYLYALLDFHINELS